MLKLIDTQLTTKELYLKSISYNSEKIQSRLESIISLGSKLNYSVEYANHILDDSLELDEADDEISIYEYMKVLIKINDLYYVIEINENDIRLGDNVIKLVDGKLRYLNDIYESYLLGYNITYLKAEYKNKANKLKYDDMEYIVSRLISRVENIKNTIIKSNENVLLYSQYVDALLAKGYSEVKSEFLQLNYTNKYNQKSELVMGNKSVTVSMKSGVLSITSEMKNLADIEANLELI